MNYYILCRDILLHLLMMTIVTLVLTMSSNVVWLFLSVGAIGLVYNTAWEKGHSEWFAVAKFAGALVGVLSLNYFRHFGMYTVNTHFFIAVILLLNISEALLRDLELGLSHIPNAITAMLLIVNISYLQTSAEQTTSILYETQQTGIFLFPCNLEWILLYTTWNATFSYGDNYSWITRLMLLPPLLVSYLLGTQAWLGARCLSLMCSMVMRAAQITYLYTPGSTPLTPIPGIINCSPWIIMTWGVVNLFFATLLYK